MPEVKVENGQLEVALRRLKRFCEKAGIPSKAREKEYYEPPTAKRRRKNAAAKRRHAIRLKREQEMLFGHSSFEGNV